MSNKQFYIVGYSEGGYEDFRQYNVFVTSDETKAILWKNKFNRIRHLAFNYYQTLHKELFHEDSDFSTHIQDRFFMIEEINGAWVEKIERR